MHSQSSGRPQSALRSPSVPNLHEPRTLQKTNTDVNLGGDFQRSSNRGQLIPQQLHTVVHLDLAEEDDDSMQESARNRRDISGNGNNSSGELGLKVESPRTTDNISVGDGNLSVIDLYGDEVESHRVRSHDHVENSDEEESNDDDTEEETPEEGIQSKELIENHDSKSITRDNTPSQPKPLLHFTNTGEFDRYGFKKQSNSIDETMYNEWWHEYSIYCNRRQDKWRIMLDKEDIMAFTAQNRDRIPTKFPPRSDKLKRYVRKGIPAEWRGNAWWYFAEGQETLDKNIGTYPKLVSKVVRLVNNNKYANDPQYKKVYYDMEIIERDLNRTFPDNIHFQRNSGEGHEPTKITALRRILVAFSIYNPKIGYCQSMNFLAGLLLLFLDEEKAFWMLVIITSKYLPGVHDVNLEGVNVDQGVLMLCLKEYIPDIWQRIDASQEHSKMIGDDIHLKNRFLYKLPPITLCTVSWFMSCFIGIVPIETTLRIWDCLFYEGSHFLFKISLGILRLCEHQVLHKKQHQSKLQHIRSRRQFSSTQHHSSLSVLDDEADLELFQSVQSFPKQLLDPNDFFEKSIFKKRLNFNSLDQHEIDKCREYVKSQRGKYREFVDSTIKRAETSGSMTPDIQTHRSRGGKHHKKSHQPSIYSGNTVLSDSKSIRTTDDLTAVLEDESYGFKRGLTSVNWNSISIKEKMKQIRKKK